MFNKLLAGLLIYVMAVSQVVAQTAALVPNAKQTFLGTTGAPLAAGTVTMYVPNSTNKKTTWVDPNQASSNTNPIVLDAAGRGIIFGQGNYRQVVKDKNGVQIWDSFTSAPGSAAPSGSTGTDTAPVGTIVAYSGFTPPTNWQFAYGQAVSRTAFPELKTAITIVDTAASCTNSSTTITGFASTAQFRVGAPIEASCIGTGITIATIAGPTSITVSSAASATVVTTATVFTWGNGDGVSTFNVPDLRGRIMPGPDAMGGTAASRLTSAFYGASASPPGVSGGAQSRTITQNQLPNVVPSFAGTPMTAGLSALDGVIITSGVRVTTGASSLSGNEFTGLRTDSFTPAGTVGSINGNVTQQAIATIQPSLTMNYIIKMTPNTTGAGGVVSIGGMFGDIVCDATFNCSPQGSPSVNTIGLASQATLTMLANVTGGSAQPTGTTNTAWLDATCGSTTGMIVMRGASTWDCLTPGASGTALVSQGPGVILHWLPTAGIGTVTSVGLSLPSIFSVSGSPVTGAGTLTGTLATQSANAIFSGPTSGGAATPTFRALVSADIPVLPNANLANPSTTVNGTTCTLGSTCTVTASSGFYTLQYVSGAWTCSDPSGASVSIAGSTTSGLQECINAMQSAKTGNFRAICPPNQSIAASTAVTFGPSAFYTYILNGCKFISTVSGTTIPISIDTMSNGSLLDWQSGAIQVNGNITNAAVSISANANDPVFSQKLFQESAIYLPAIYTPLNGGAAGSLTACVQFIAVASGAQIINNRFYFAGIDGGSGTLACGIGMYFANPAGASNAIVQNIINAPLITNARDDGILMGTSTPTGVLGTNTLNVGITTTGSATSCIRTFAILDVWNVSTCSVNSGTLTNGITFNAGADHNYIIAPQMFNGVVDGGTGNCGVINAQQKSCGSSW